MLLALRPLFGLADSEMMHLVLVLCLKADCVSQSHACIHCPEQHGVRESCPSQYKSVHAV